LGETAGKHLERKISDKKEASRELNLIKGRNLAAKEENSIPGRKNSDTRVVKGAHGEN